MSFDLTEEYLDIATVGVYKLICYSSFLAFGKPTINQLQLQLNKNAYFLIKEHHFGEYFEFFESIVQSLVPSTETTKDEQTKLIAAKDVETKQTKLIAAKGVETKLISATESLETNCVTYIIKETGPNGQIEINSKYNVNLTFVLDFEEAYAFMIGFRNMCFKIYCYPIDIQELVFFILKTDKSDLFSNESRNNLEIFNYLNSYYSGFSVHQIYFISNIIQRHQKLLLAIKTSMEDIKEKIF